MDDSLSSFFSTFLCLICSGEKCFLKQLKPERRSVGVVSRTEFDESLALTCHHGSFCLLHFSACSSPPPLTPCETLILMDFSLFGNLLWSAVLCWPLVYFNFKWFQLFKLSLTVFSFACSILVDCSGFKINAV